MNKVQFDQQILTLKTNLIELKLQTPEKARSAFNFVHCFNIHHV